MGEEYVIRGNSALLKCNIPSFVADFVHVTAWTTDDGQTYLPSDNYGKINISDLQNFYVIFMLSIKFDCYHIGSTDFACRKRKRKESHLRALILPIYL